MAKKIIQPALFEPEAAPIAQCKLPAGWFKEFEKLTDDELRVLIILAYVGEEYSEFKWYATKIKGIHTIVAQREIIRKLNDLGLLQEHEHYYGDSEYEIEKTKLLATMLYALDRCPQIHDQIKRKVQVNPVNESLWGIVEAYYNGAKNLSAYREAMAHEYYELHLMLDDFIATDFLDAMCTAMPVDDFNYFIHGMLNRTYLYDLDNSLNMTDYCWYLHGIYWENERSNISYHIQNDLIVMYEFIYSGCCLHPMSQVPNKYQHMVKAVLKLYQGKYKESMSLFGEAMKAYNHSMRTKNIIPNQIMCFYLMVCYAKLGDEKKAKAFTNKAEVLEDETYTPALLVALKLILGQADEIDDYIRIMLQEYTNPASRMFAMLFARLFTDHNIAIPRDIQARVPRCALLRYEMSATGMPCVDRDSLRKALGGEPILTTVKVKQKWENLLETLQTLQAETQSKPVAPKKNERLVYVVSDHFYYGRSIELHRQKSLKAGGWGKPFAISHATFLNKNVSFAEPVDYDIIKTLLAHKSSRLSECFPCEYVLPHLIGSDKVLYLDTKRKEFLPIQVIEQKPYIQLDKSKTGYIVTTNVSINKKQSELSEYAVSWLGDSQAIVYRLTEFERQAIYQLCKQGKFPLEAEKQLQSFIYNISNQLEVHSELIEGGSLLEKKQASSVIVVRLDPTNEGCALKVYVSPTENSQLHLFPGRGTAVIYDEVGGTRYQVERDLAGEKKRLHTLQTFLLETTGVAIEHDEPAVLDLESVLALLQFINDNSEAYKVEWPEGKRYKLQNMHTKDFEAIQVVSKERWFEIEGELKIGEKEAISAAEILRLLQQERIGKRFVRLNDDEFIALSDSLAKQLLKLEKIAQVDSKKAIINRLQVGELAKIIQASNNTIKTNEQVTALAQKIQDSAQMPVAQPKGLQAQLRDYQQIGYEWMSRLAAWGAGGCLADDMGLGKTVQAIAFLLQRAKEGPSMVVAPASVVFNWQNELQRFAPTLRVYILNEAVDRKELIQLLKANDILLTTYGLLVREEEALTAKKWNVVCLDEAHTIKNRTTKMSQVAMELQAQARLLLTGTPVQNHLGELWNLFQFLNPGLLGSYEWFNRRYIQPIEQGNDERRSQLRRLVQPFILRRTKAEVVEELPDKIEMTRQVELTDNEYAAYEALRIEAKQSLEKENKVTVSVLSEITRLREAACSLALINKSWTEGSSKLDDMSALVAQIVEGGNRVLIFSQFTSFLSQAKQVVDEMGIDSFYLDGSTPLAKRKKMVEEFQQGEKSVFFISLKAGGLGLNLTGANYVIHLDPWWNPAIEQQATDRAYRIGQEQKVTVYHLIAKGTIEEKILRLHQSKRDIADSILDGTNSSHALNLDDLRYLLALEE